jgi:PAS domain-containing protein
LYGFTRSEVIGRRVHDLLGTALPHNLDEVKTALRQHGRWEGTLTHTTKDDRQIVVDTRMAPLQFEGGPARVLQANRDVTSGKRTEEALRASESRFRQLAEATPAMIWQVSPDGSLTYVNQRLRDYLGSETMRAADWRDAIHPDDVPRLEPFRESAWASMTADVEGRDAVLRIRDTGIGIAPEALPHLFEMFHQEGNILVLDIGLPIMNGYAVAQELRRRPAMHHVHIAALTGWGQSEDRPRAREAGFDTHFTKPVSATAVKEKICCRRWLWVSNMPATPTAGHAPGSATDRSCHDDRCPTKRDRDLNL